MSMLYEFCGNITSICICSATVALPQSEQGKNSCQETLKTSQIQFRIEV